MTKWAILFLIVSIVTIVLAEEKTGIIKGSVVDKQANLPLAGANILVVGTNRGAAANLEGNFVINNVPVGIYVVEASVIGYKTVRLSDIVVSQVKPTVLEFKLEETSIQFGEITVKPDYFSDNLDKPISTQMQSNEEIRRLPGGLEDVVRAVSILPGVSQAQSGRNDLIVRGGAPSENLYVVDGIQVPNINHFGTQGASGGPISFINLDFVKNTSFSSGGFGVKYGDKLSSVLTIDLKEGRKDNIGGKSTISATQFGFNLEGPVKDNGSFIVSARRSYLDFIFKASGFGFVPEYWDFLAKVNYDLDENDQINFLAIGALDRTRFFNDTAEKRYENSRTMGSSQNQIIGGVSWKHVLPKGYTRLTLGQTYYDFNYQQNDTLQQTLFKNNSVEQEISLTADLYYNVAGSELTLGLQTKALGFNSDLSLPPFRDDFGNLLFADVNYNTTAHKSSGWAQLSRQINRLNITAGARFDYFNMIQNSTVVSPRLSAQYSISNLTTLSGSVGRYFQSPAMIWIVSNDANNQLQHIGVNQYIVGIEHLIRDDTKISLEGYLKQYFDYPASLTRPYLVMANTGAGFGGSNEGFSSFGIDPLASLGSGTTRGIELFIQKKLSDSPVYGIFSLSYNKTEFTALDGITRPGAYDQRWILNLGGGYIFNEEWEISTKFRYATGRPYTPYNTDFLKSAELYNSSRIPANHFLDIRVDKRWYWGKTVLITYLDIQNIYNRQPYTIPRYNEFDNELEKMGTIGILPSIGISVEF